MDGSSMLDTQERVGEIVAAHRLARDILVLVGWSADAMATDGLASLGKSRSERGRFRAASWLATETTSKRWFVAAIRVPEVGEAPPGEYLLLHSIGARNPMMACLPQAIVDAHGFAAVLKARLGRRIDEAAQFLLDTMSNRATRKLSAVSTFLTAVVDAASEEDGVIEILGAIEGEGLLLQGWLRQPSSGKQPMKRASSHRQVKSISEPTGVSAGSRSYLMSCSCRTTRQPVIYATGCRNCAPTTPCNAT